MIPKIVPIGTPNLKEVPASLRMLAEQIESGKVPKAEHVIIVAVSDGDMQIYGYGTVENRAHEIGCLHMAILKLATE
jgi:hypothetical protein